MVEWNGNKDSQGSSIYLRRAYATGHDRDRDGSRSSIFEGARQPEAVREAPC